MALRRKSRKSQRKSNKTARKRRVHRGGARCPACAGSGGYDSTSQCYACDGKGGHMEEVNFRGYTENMWQSCQICRGSGEIKNFITCSRCHGSGTVPDE